MNKIISFDIWAWATVEWIFDGFYFWNERKVFNKIEVWATPRKYKCAWASKWGLRQL